MTGWGVAVRVRAESDAGKTVVDGKTLRLVAEVEDSGPGIAAEDIDMIFDAFQQSATGAKAGGAIPIIAITASAFEDDFERVMATGMYAYLRKPFRPEDLFEALGKSLDLHYLFAEEAAAAPSHLKAVPLTGASLAALPKDVIQAMRRSVAEGNLECAI